MKTGRDSGGARMCAGARNELIKPLHTRLEAIFLPVRGGSRAVDHILILYEPAICHRLIMRDLALPMYARRASTLCLSGTH